MPREIRAILVPNIEIVPMKRIQLGGVFVKGSFMFDCFPLS